MTGSSDVEAIRVRLVAPSGPRGAAVHRLGELLDGHHDIVLLRGGNDLPALTDLARDRNADAAVIGMDFLLEAADALWLRDRLREMVGVQDPSSASVGESESVALAGAAGAGLPGVTAAGPGNGAAMPPSERIPVELPGRVRLVPVEDIDYIVASGPYAELHVGDRTHLIREQMHELERRLDPAQFVRVHRSTIVRLELIETLLRGSGGKYEVVLSTGARLRVSRSRREDLERRLGVTRSDQRPAPSAQQQPPTD